MTATDSLEEMPFYYEYSNNIKDPGIVKETVEENSDKIKVLK